MGTTQAYGNSAMPCSWPSSTLRTKSTGPAPSWIAEVFARLAVGKNTGPNPTDRRKRGSQQHVLTDAQGVPLAVLVTGAHRHDVPQLLPLLEAIPPVRGKRGRPRRRPRRVQGERGYDAAPHRQARRAWGITPVLAQRGTDHGRGLGLSRWVVERTLAWLPQWRRLRVRDERRADIHEAVMLPSNQAAANGGLWRLWYSHSYCKGGLYPRAE
jgi:transposase